VSIVKLSDCGTATRAHAKASEVRDSRVSDTNHSAITPENFFDMRLGAHHIIFVDKEQFASQYSL
jgi:hypothetical protein